MTKRKKRKNKQTKRKRKRKRQTKSFLDEPISLIKLGITTTATLGAYSMTLDALSKMKK